jgi:hypothetical protein
MNEDFIMELNNRLDRLIEKTHRIKRALEAAKDGTPFSEVFDEILYQEATYRKIRAGAFISLIIKNLLKVKYCNGNLPAEEKNTWIPSIQYHRENASVEMTWGNKPDKIIVRYVKNNLQNSYNNGIYFYKNEAKEYPDLQDGIKFIPVECPWELEELMDEPIDFLLSKLPSA